MDHPSCQNKLTSLSSCSLVELSRNICTLLAIAYTAAAIQTLSLTSNHFLASIMFCKDLPHLRHSCSLRTWFSGAFHALDTGGSAQFYPPYLTCDIEHKFPHTSFQSHVRVESSPLLLFAMRGVLVKPVAGGRRGVGIEYVYQQDHIFKANN